LVAAARIGRRDAPGRASGLIREPSAPAARSRYDGRHIATPDAARRSARCGHCAAAESARVKRKPYSLRRARFGAAPYSHIRGVAPAKRATAGAHAHAHGGAACAAQRPCSRTRSAGARRLARRSRACATGSHGWRSPRGCVCRRRRSRRSCADSDSAGSRARARARRAPLRTSDPDELAHLDGRSPGRIGRVGTASRATTTAVAFFDCARRVLARRRIPIEQSERRPVGASTVSSLRALEARSKRNESFRTAAAAARRGAG